MDRTEENRQEYKELQRRVKREVSKAKQKAYDELYTRLDTREGEKDLYRLARQRDRDGKDVQQVRVIKDRDGRVLTSEESVQRRWKEYFEELMNEENEREKRVEGVNSVEQKVDKIRKDEVRKALKRMKSGKAVGPDDIPVEVWKCLGEAAVEFLANLFNRVLESERMPEKWRRSVLVPIFKNKGDVQSCSNYRGIKLMSHTMKLWERVVEARLRKVVEICEQQYGFMPRKSTTDAIFALRILMEKYRDGQRELHCVFVDLEKAYDRVPREELWYCMRKSGVAEKYVRVVQDMYERSRTVVRCALGQTEEFNVEVGLHQGSALSPFLFAIVMDQLSEEVRQESPWTMMFADDIVICSESREQVEENLERWRFALERRGMKVSRSKGGKWNKITVLLLSGFTCGASFSKVQVFTVRVHANFSNTATLITTNATLDISLIGISTAVALVSYTNMADILEHSFNTFTDTDKTMMSIVVSATLPKSNNPKLTEPINFTLKHIKHFVIGPCAKNFLYQIPVHTPQELPQEMVKNYLNIIMNLSTRMTDDVSDNNYLASYGDVVLNVTEQLVSRLVRKRDPSINLNLSLQDLAVQVFVMVGPNVSVSEIPQIGTSNTSIEFDLVEISKNNNGSAAVAFISYTNMTNIVKPTLLETLTSTIKTMMSNVVSVSFPKTVNTTLTKPVKITFKHINEFDPEGILSCVYWNKSVWLKEDYGIIQTNRTHTMCSYSHLSTFALIMQTDPCRMATPLENNSSAEFAVFVHHLPHKGMVWSGMVESDHLMKMLIAVAIIVGIIFLSLSIVTLTLYSRNPVTNTALINLCINLLLFLLLSLIKTLFLAHIHSQQLRAVLAGIQWFFLMSVFVWTFTEAVLLYNFAKNLSNTTSVQEEVFSWKWLIVIGYLIPLGVLGMTGVRFPKGYVDEECWLNQDNSFFIFAGPVLLTVALNLVPYGIIITIFTLKYLKNEILPRSSSDDKNLIICLMLRSLTQFIILICYFILLYIPSKNGVLYHTFQFLNSQQGTFIFLIHCLLNQEVRAPLKPGCPNYGPRANCDPRVSFYWPAAIIIEYGPHMAQVTEVMCPEKVQDFNNVSLSRNTVVRRIEDLSANLKLQLREKACAFDFYSIACDESTDATDTAQLLIFLRGVDDNFCCTEELLDMMSCLI
ncbi:hypothetical protein QTP70_030147 [Hemibagrus guttatus]|uniref:ribonuclease H n=1 Tax=Hemibagrus guttatus TaxID=175788 RepID=A0AAE0ULW5_9TELE|nr:hypothetical protein QTP70_030147 [Hemibagrus guttatus]